MEVAEVTEIVETPPIDQNAVAFTDDPNKILTSYNTPLVCTSCGITGGTFYLKRRRGLYALLCFRNGEGCWEHSARSLCSYTDAMQAQCQSLSEWEVVSLDRESSRHVCAFHIPAVIKPGTPGNQIFPLED